MTESKTPRTTDLHLGINARSSLRGFVMPEDVNDAIELAEALETELAAAKAELREVRKDYNELLYQVGNKYPGETRHQTALRYLKNAENQNNSAQCKAAIAEES